MRQPLPAILSGTQPLDFSLRSGLHAICGRCPGVATTLGRYRHLVIDNTEEDTPVNHDTLLSAAATRSPLVIYDTGAGYRRFLTADPTSAYRLKGAWSTSRSPSPSSCRPMSQT